MVFGSHLHGQFALDTVFVVNGRTPVGDTHVSQLFRRVNDSCFDDTTLPVYRGACLNQPLGALVSFFRPNRRLLARLPPLTGPR
ncbi:MAG: hypothetical protein U1E47_09935 [Rivihabitans pingtungensis]